MDFHKILDSITKFLKWLHCKKKNVQFTAKTANRNVAYSFPVNFAVELNVEKIMSN